MYGAPATIGPLAAIGDWGQLIFVLVALIGWVIKTIVEAREERSKQGARKTPSKQPPQRSRLRRGLEATAKALAEGMRDESPAPPASRPQGARPPPTPIEEFGPPSEEPRHERKRIHVGKDSRSKVTTEQERGRTVTRLEASSRAALVVRTSEQVRRTRALGRLGVTGGGGRRALRRAILWSEVIGMPRYARGPHRSPAAERIARKR